MLSPPSGDLAAQLHRAWLGTALWDNQWYGGHPTPGYSVLSPLLAAVAGPRVLGALSVVAAAACFAELVHRARPGRPAWWAALWFGAGVGAQLFTGRITFLLGVAVGLASLLAAQRDRRVLALVLAVGTSLASPVAGLFLALCGGAWLLGARRLLGLGLAVAALGGAMALTLLFGEGGTEPFVPNSFWPAFFGLLALAAVAGRREPEVAIGCVLAAALCAGTYFIPSPIGGNSIRLGALASGPVSIAVLWPYRRWAAVLLFVPLLHWQLNSPWHDSRLAAGDPSTRAAYYAPLLAQLRARGGPPGRVDVPFTLIHWESTLLGDHVPLARGWERQVDRARDPLFYRRGTTRAILRAWLRRNAVRWVALPDVRLDPSSFWEAHLLRSGIHGLHQVWHGAHWRLYAVSRPRPLVDGAATLVRLGVEDVVLRGLRRGPALVRVHFSPHWAVVQGSGCVSRSPGDWTRVDVRRPGLLRLAQRISIVRALTGAGGPRCG